MFTFARTVMDVIQSATGLKIHPGYFHFNQDKEDKSKRKVPSEQRKSHSPVSYVANTPIGSALQSYKQSLIAAHALSFENMPTALIEEDFVYALSNYCTNFTLQSGIKVIIRPILPCDIERMREVLESGGVSQQSLSLRFNTVTTCVKEHILHYFTNIDYDTHFAISALVEEEGTWKCVATARIIQDETEPEIAEWAALVMDKYHGHGIGSCLLYYLAHMASTHDIHHLSAVVHSDNYPVLHWMKKLNGHKELINDCRYWLFETPIYDNWIEDENIRINLNNASSGKGKLNSESLNVLRTNVKQLDTPVYLNNDQPHNDKIGIKKKSEKHKRSAPVVSFVSPFEDELDLGDLF